MGALRGARQSVAPHPRNNKPLERAFLSPTGPSAGASATNERARWDTDAPPRQATRLTGNRRVGGKQATGLRVAEMEAAPARTRARRRRQKRDGRRQWTGADALSLVQRGAQADSFRRRESRRVQTPGF